MSVKKSIEDTPVCVDGREQRRQPVCADLAVGVEEDDDLAPRGHRAVVPAPDETLSLGVPDEPHPPLVVRLLQLALEGLVQVLQLRFVVDEQHLFQHFRGRSEKAGLVDVATGYYYLIGTIHEAKVRTPPR